MDLSLWAKLNGTLINVATVALGTGLGLALRGRLPERMQTVIMQALGLVTIFIGLSMAGSMNKAGATLQSTAQATQPIVVDGVVIGLVGLVVGGLLGEWWRVEERLAALGDWLKAKFNGSGRFTEGFVAASLLFCIGPMTLIGSINNGLIGDSQLLIIKAALDGLAAIALASSFGIGVGFSILIILIYQGGVALAAGALATILPNPAVDPRVLIITGVGGLMVVGVGINLLDLTKIRVASLLPALLMAPLFHWLISLL
ncbi:MAG: DUF554 domain-containing protein [Chloroflexi bacterium]|nr:DUF554 domain-containing protein [Chloroflexota bacterium]